MVVIGSPPVGDRAVCGCPQGSGHHEGAGDAGLLGAQAQAVRRAAGLDVEAHHAARLAKQIIFTAIPVQVNIFTILE